MAKKDERRVVVLEGMRAEREQQAREFGGRLRRVRESRGFSQEELAEKAEVSRSVVSVAELGRSLPQPRNRRKLSEALGVDLGDLWVGEALDEGARDRGRA